MRRAGVAMRYLKGCERQRPGTVFGTAREYIPVGLRQKRPADSMGQRNTLGCISLEVLYGHDQKGSYGGGSS
jgi:hypothetical protein